MVHCSVLELVCNPQVPGNVVCHNSFGMREGSRLLGCDDACKVVVGVVSIKLTEGSCWGRHDDGCAAAE